MNLAICLKLFGLITFLAQDDTTEISRAAAAGVSAGASVGGLVFSVLLCAFMWWKVFTKAGQPGWGSLIPIVNVYFLCKVAGRPGWWVILFILPCVNIFAIIVVCLDVAKAFGKGTGFTIGLILLPFIFYPILGFGDAAYLGRPASPAAA
jgi:Family of unknown function (DUF5684)